MMRVIDLTHFVAGPFATLLLAELDADVIKVERPGGDPWRRRATEVPNDVSFDFLNRRKRGVTLDLSNRSGHTLFLDLVAHADAVVENFSPGTLSKLGLSYQTMRKANPDIVLTSITNFGQRGPHADWQATEFVLQAMGGIVWGTGWDDGPPLQLPGYQACYIAGLNAAAATLAAVDAVRGGVERGVHIDVSIQETFTMQWTRQVTKYLYAGRPYRRERRGAGRQGFPHTVQAKDGWLYMLAMRAEWEPFAYFLGLEQFITHEWSDPADRAARWDEIAPDFHEAIRSRGRYQWVTDAAERGYTFAPIDTPLDLPSSPQLTARGFFDEAEFDDGERVPCAGLPFPTAEEPARSNRAPRLGEHNREVYMDVLELGNDQVTALERAGVI
ncbi:MAG: CaiB/BaiF CoA transferase family protein [Dehalococcoidia bacterium]